MTALCVLAAMLAAGLVIGPARRHALRLSGVLHPRQPAVPGIPVAKSAAHLVRRAALAALVLAAGVVAGAGVLGIALGAAGTIAVLALRTSPTDARIDPDEVPLVADLVAGCLASGAAMPDALDAAVSAAGGELRSACAAVSRALRSGATADEAWQSWLADPWLAPVARTAIRTARSGAATADDLRRISGRLRARRRARVQHRVRRASVWLVVPLGLCFLPAFVLVAVVPLVAGLVPGLG
jgi:Flp pilus assembly protein TadB